MPLPQTRWHRTAEVVTDAAGKSDGPKRGKDGAPYGDHGSAPAALARAGYGYRGWTILGARPAVPPRQPPPGARPPTARPAWSGFGLSRGTAPAHSHQSALAHACSTAMLAPPVTIQVSMWKLAERPVTAGAGACPGGRDHLPVRVGGVGYGLGGCPVGWRPTGRSPSARWRIVEAAAHGRAGPQRVNCKLNPHSLLVLIARQPLFRLSGATRSALLSTPGSRALADPRRARSGRRAGRTTPHPKAPTGSR